MSATEIANLVHTQLSFIGSNPSPILGQNGNVEDIEILGAGEYRVNLKNKVPTAALDPRVQIFVNLNLFGFAAFASGYRVGDGDIVVQTFNSAGVANHTGGTVELLILAYPTFS